MSAAMGLSDDNRLQCLKKKSFPMPLTLSGSGMISSGEIRWPIKSKHDAPNTNLLGRTTSPLASNKDNTDWRCAWGPRVYPY